MKTKFFYALLAVAIPIVSFGQQDTLEDDPPSIIEPIPNTVPEIYLQQVQPSDATMEFLAQHFENYRAYYFDFGAVESYFLNNHYALEFNLNADGTQTFFSVQRKDLRSPNFVESETLENGETFNRFERDSLNDSLYIPRLVHGFANRTRHELCRFAIYHNNFTGYHWNTESNELMYYISLQEFIKESGSQFTTDENFLLVYNLKDLITQSNSLCEILEEGHNEPQPLGYFDQCAPRFLEIAAEGDYWWCNAFGGNATNKILENLFFVEGIYTFYFNLSFVVNHISLIPTNSSMYNTTSSNDKIAQFRSFWNANRGWVDRDIAILYTSKSYTGGVIGNAYPFSICNVGSAYATMQNHPKNILILAHELGHVFGSLHDEDYGSSTCSGSDTPIMCSYAIAAGPNYYFSPHTRNLILTSINDNAGCLSDHANGPMTAILKSWSNFRNPRWIATWFMNIGDQKVVGNFDGENDDEEIFFASPNKAWVGIMDFSCDQGTDWYHLWGNSGNGTFGTWYRNYGDRYLGGDCDGNGKTDLISVSGNRHWFALQEYNPSTWSWIHKWGNSGSHWVASWYLQANDSYRVADFDGDGKDDLLCTNPNGWAQLIKFNWNSGGYYVPQTIWSNNGNGWLGGVQVNNTTWWLSGKYATLAKDELFTISGNWVTTQRYNGSGWDWIWSQYGASHFASMYILPLNGDQRILNGNFDNDPQHEVVNLNKTWTATADYDGSNYVQNWNNGGTQRLNDWQLNHENEYLFVKAAPTDEKQILGIRTDVTVSGWWIFKKYTYTQSVAGMYKANPIMPDFVMPNTNNGGDAEAEQAPAGLKVDPNPALNNITVEFDNTATKASGVILDITGKKISEVELSVTSPTMGIEHLAQGSYILQITFDNNTFFTTQFIVQE